MSFATDLTALKNAITGFANLVKNKFADFIPVTEKGATNGVCPLVNGVVPSENLPSYVDDVLEYPNFASFPLEGESGKIYVDLTINPATGNISHYRWTGSAYFKTSSDSNIAGALEIENQYQMDSLGIGTAPPPSGELRVFGNMMGNFSDGRLKTVIGTIENALDKIDTLTGIIYVNNELANSFGYHSTAEQVGLDANAVKLVQPQVVHPAPFDIAQHEDGSEYSKSGQEYMTMQYEKLVPLLIEGIKELRREVKAIKEQMN